MGQASANTGRFRVGAGSKRLEFANFPGAQSLITFLLPLVMEIRPETIYPQILSTPLHVGAVFPNTTPYGSLRPHDPTALLHSITVCFPVFPLLLRELLVCEAAADYGLTSCSCFLSCTSASSNLS